MIVFGGDSGTRLLDDTKVMDGPCSSTELVSRSHLPICALQILSLDKLTWDSVAPKVRPPPTGRSPKLRPCKGHCLV
jgi:hypothetical protein